MSGVADLTRAWRLLGRLGHVDSIFNHISSCAGADTFWINKMEVIAANATPEAFIELRLDDDAPASPLVNPDGWQLHASIYRARGRAGAAVHTHAQFSTAVANTSAGLLPTSQAAMELVPLVQRVDYEGPFRDCGSSGALRSIATDGGVALLQSHGVLVVADSLEEATYLAYYVEEACKVQVMTMAQGSDFRRPPESAIASAERVMTSERPRLAARWFDAMTTQESR